MPKSYENNIFNEPDCAADLAIVGLGPGGLAAALTINNEKQVIAFTDRTDYIRGQRLILAKPTISFLKQYIDKLDPQDLQFWNKFAKERTVQIKDIERFLYRKLIKKPNVQIVSLEKQGPKSMQSISKEEGINFIQLEDGTKYYCQSILAADGARHICADKVQANLGLTIDYRISPLQERHRYHAVVQLQLKNGEQPGPIVKDGIIKKISSFAEQGWNQSYYPKNFVFANAARTKFYFAGEIPEQIFSEEDETKRIGQLKTWASKAIYQKFGATEAQLEFRTSRKTPAKDSLQASVFKMQMIVCEKPFVDLEHGVFAQIGDARRTTNYNLVHGINDAIRGGVAFANAMTDKAFDKQSFTQFIEKMDARIENKMQTSQDKGAITKEENKQKLIHSMDKLIRSISWNPNHQKMIETIQEAQNRLRMNDDLSIIYDVINTVLPLIEHHENNSFPYRSYHSLVSLFDSQAEQIKQIAILEEIKTHLEAYYQRPTI